MKVIIKNMSNDTKQIQYYRKYHFAILKPRDTLVLGKITQEEELRYYNSLVLGDFSVCFHSEDGECEDELVKTTRELQYRWKPHYTPENLIPKPNLDIYYSDYTM